MRRIDLILLSHKPNKIGEIFVTMNNYLFKISENMIYIFLSTRLALTTITKINYAKNMTLLKWWEENAFEKGWLSWGLIENSYGQWRWNDCLPNLWTKGLNHNFSVLSRRPFLVYQKQRERLRHLHSQRLHLRSNKQREY